MPKSKAIIKFFPKGYIVHSHMAMVPFRTPDDCWHVVVHHGQDENGLEIFEIQGSKYPYASKQGAIRQYKCLLEHGVL